MKEEKSKKNIRHPTKSKLSKLTYSPPSISIGKKERALLRYLYQQHNKRFNLKEYSRITKIPRPTIYDYLNKLENYELVKRESANNKITKKGMVLLESTEKESVGGSRQECRKNKLSTHYHKFKLPISNKSRFNKVRLKKINPIDVKENRLHNLHQTIVYFEDATILINPKQLIINLYEIISDDVEETDLKSLSRAIEYAKKFMKVGIKTEGIIVEEGHWARIESVLSDFLYNKVDKRYFLDLGKGKKFWIDHSLNREDETNDKVVRERVDKFLTQISNNDFDLNDINKVKESLGFITKLESVRLMDKIEENKLKRIEIERPSIKFGGWEGYIG